MLGNHENLYDGDYSPEEMRFDAYVAQAQGTFPQHQANVQQMIATCAQNWQSVIADPLAAMNRAVNGGASGSSGDGGDMDDGAPDASQQAAANLFGNSAASTNTIAPANLFGGAPAAAAGAAPTATNAFGQAQAAAQPNTGLGFGQAPAATAAAAHTYVARNTPERESISVLPTLIFVYREFGFSRNTFGFAGASQAASTTASSFSGTSGAAGTTLGGLAGAQPSALAGFSSPAAAAAPATQAAAQPAGGAAAPGASGEVPAGMVQKAGLVKYALDEAGLEQYRAAQFTFGKIPEFPPPPELCR